MATDHTTCAHTWVLIVAGSGFHPDHDTHVCVICGLHNRP